MSCGDFMCKHMFIGCYLQKQPQLKLLTSACGMLDHCILISVTNYKILYNANHSRQKILLLQCLIEIRGKTFAVVSFIQYLTD